MSGYMGGYMEWQNNCNRRGISLGQIFIVTGNEGKMEITHMNAGPFI